MSSANDEESRKTDLVLFWELGQATWDILVTLSLRHGHIHTTAHYFVPRVCAVTHYFVPREYARPY